MLAPRASAPLLESLREPTALFAGATLGSLAGLALASGGALPGVALLGAIGVLGLTPLVVALGRFALPVWIGLFGILYPFARFPVDDPVVTFDRLFLGALLVGYALSHVPRRRAPETVWLQRSLLLLAAVFFVSAVTTSGTVTTGLAIWADALLLPLILFWCAREAARCRRELISIAGAIAFAGAAIAALGLAQRFGGLDLAPLLGTVDRFDKVIGEVRISGPFAAPEPFATVLLGCLAATLWWVRARGPGVLLPGGIAIALELAAVFFTFFRAAWLGAVLILLVAFVLGRRGWQGRVVASAVACAGLALVLTVAGGNDDVQTRLEERRNVSGRLATYERGVELFRDRPVFGHGFQRFDDAARRAPRAGSGGTGELSHAHSSVVSTLVEQGLFGLLPLLTCAVALIMVLRALWLRAGDRVDRALAIDLIGATLAFLVMSATLTMIYRGPSNAIMALLVGLGCGRLDVLTRAGR